ncbi:MAG: hypothetical protein J3Q66DRAFT_398829 [Benniella sp.]|nr:MAG: hypothetical protein J3Q66DRAFT_398829 [Benniella sp.]
MPLRFKILFRALMIFGYQCSLGTSHQPPLLGAIQGKAIKLIGLPCTSTRRLLIVTGMSLDIATESSSVAETKPEDLGSGSPKKKRPR